MSYITITLFITSILISLFGLLIFKDSGDVFFIGSLIFIAASAISLNIDQKFKKEQQIKQTP